MEPHTEAALQNAPAPAAPAAPASVAPKKIHPGWFYAIFIVAYGLIFQGVIGAIGGAIAAHLIAREYRRPTPRIWAYILWAAIGATAVYILGFLFMVVVLGGIVALGGSFS